MKNGVKWEMIFFFFCDLRFRESETDCQCFLFFLSKIKNNRRKIFDFGEEERDEWKKEIDDNLH